MHTTETHNARGAYINRIDGPAKTWISPMDEPVFGSGDNQVGALDIHRISDKGVGALMGKAWRNPITGSVKIKQFGSFQDFCVADLWTRYGLSGTPEQLAKDPYLFRPIPMTMRTWIYHHLFRAGHILSGENGAAEDGVIRHVLAMHCIDAQAQAGGKWAPVVLHVPMILCLCIAADINASFGAICMLALTIAIYCLANTPQLYRFSRIVTFPIRLVLFYWLIARMGVKADKEEPSMMAQLGFIVAIVFCIAEIIAGDIGSLIAYRLHCSYEVVKALPNRIFICRRLGAAHSQSEDSRSNAVSEKITGMGFWQEDFALIADVKGLIVELRPMSLEDWKLVFMEKQEDEGIVHRYIGLDVYSPGAATIDALSAAMDEMKRMAERNKEKKEWAVVEA